MANVKFITAEGGARLLTESGNFLTTEFILDSVIGVGGTRTGITAVELMTGAGKVTVTQGQGKVN